MEFLNTLHGKPRGKPVSPLPVLEAEAHCWLSWGGGVSFHGANKLTLRSAKVACSTELLGKRVSILIFVLFLLDKSYLTQVYTADCFLNQGTSTWRIGFHIHLIIFIDSCKGSLLNFSSYRWVSEPRSIPISKYWVCLEPPIEWVFEF